MKYFAIIDGEQRGPYTLEELEKAGVGPETYVWCKVMKDWQPASEVGEICRYFRQSLHSRMHPVTPEAQNEADNKISQPGNDLPLRWQHILNRHNIPAEMMPEPEPNLTTPPPSWIGPAIAVLILCCPLTGAVAFYYAIKSLRLWKTGRSAEAHLAARTAKIWVLASMVAACFIIAIVISKMT